MDMKKLRVYYKSSLLSEILYFYVENPAEGKVLIDGLEKTVGKIINEHSLLNKGAYGIGLEEQDASGEWIEWYSASGLPVDEYEGKEGVDALRRSFERNCETF